MGLTYQEQRVYKCVSCGREATAPAAPTLCPWPRCGSKKMVDKYASRRKTKTS